MYPTPVSEEEMERDLRFAQEIVDYLASLYGRYPNNQLVMKLLEDEDFLMVPHIATPFRLSWDGETINSTAVHEIGHFFTRDLTRTHELWLNEGISAILTMGYGLTLDDRRDIMVEDFLWNELSIKYLKIPYERLKNGDNVFSESEFYTSETSTESGTIEHRKLFYYYMTQHWLGRFFFYALVEDYGVERTQVWDFLQALVRIAEDGRTIGVEEVRIAAAEGTRKDISPLLKLIEPGVFFLGEYGGYSGIQEKVETFFQEYPQYATEKVTWLD